MNITILHNISRDAGFGLNAVFDEQAGGKRQARTAERHPLTAVFAYSMELETMDEARAWLAGEHVMSDEELRQRLLNIAWQQFNVGDSELARAYRARQLRSLSAGDVILLDHRAYACDHVGWRRVPLGELRILRGDEAEQQIREQYGFDDDEALSVTVPLSARETQVALRSYAQAGGCVAVDRRDTPASTLTAVRLHTPAWAWRDGEA